MDLERRHFYQTLIGVVALFGFSIFLSLTPLALLSSLTSAVVVSCTHNQPQLLLSSSDSSLASSSLAYSLQITNTDTRACRSSTFDLQSDLPDHSFGVFSNDPVTLQPGETITVTFRLLFDDTFPSGAYLFTIRAMPLDTPALAASLTLQRSFP